ncbi:hypothetical protein LCGC14_1153260 [marine sediment metagenome]|uniref:Uncharacterized protein n=1 Tax=marine sediment metagenome TaxID=412755 RepID=A0A0F9LUT5_9ZZZZ
MGYQALLKVGRPSYKWGDIDFSGFALGLNTSVRPTQLKLTELAQCINFININPAGYHKTRGAINKYTNSATTNNSPVKAFKKVFIGSTSYELLIDAAYKVYYLDGSLDPVAIGTLEGDGQIIGFNGVAVLLDGSFIKYLDGVSAIKIAYDDGTGPSGYQFNNRAGDNDSTLELGNGTNTRIAYKFTSQAWTAGYTIPATTVIVKVSAQGTPNASAITASLRKVSDNSIIATGTLIDDASDLTSVAEELSVEMTVSSEMLPSIAYYMSIEHTGGDGANNVLIHCTDVSGGAYAYYWTGSWNLDNTAQPLMGMRPGIPPKAAFGDVWAHRLHVAGDPDNPAYDWFCNLTHLDWSTPDGGGYVAAVDEDAQSFPIGGISTIFTDLLVYGKQDHPYICNMIGDTPADYELPVMFQKVWSTHKTLISSVNDVWAASYEGVMPITGVELYGDLRVKTASDRIINLLQAYWDTDTALAGFYPKESQYWLVLPTYHRVLVCRTKFPATDPDDGGPVYPWFELELYRDRLRRSAYKWTASGSGTNEYHAEIAAGGDPSIAVSPDFITVDGVKWAKGTLGSLSDHTWGFGDNDTLGYSSVYLRDDSGDPDTTEIDVRSILVPTCLANESGVIFIGGSDGFVYHFDSDEYKDQGLHQILPRLRGPYVSLAYKNVNFDDLQLLASSLTGAGLSINLYKNDAYLTPFQTVLMNLAVSDALTLGEATMDLGDALFTLGAPTNPIWRHLNFNARSVQIGVTNVSLAGEPVYINGFGLKYRYLSQ